MKRLSIIGCGKAARTLASLWHRRKVFQIGEILNRSLGSATEAVRFIGAGCPVQSIDQLQEADVFLIGTPDSQIQTVCESLVQHGPLRRNDVVFHLSGALSSQVLLFAKTKGARIASVHPIKSFADPAIAAKTFTGTFCGLEGDEEACSFLEDAFKEIGAWTFRLSRENKPIYHAATVLVCNYLVALLEVGLRCLEHAGLARQQAMEIIKPLVKETVENVFRLGPTGALTGPIARGDTEIIQLHCDALDRWQRSIACVYRVLGEITADIARHKGEAPPERLEAICNLLRNSSNADGSNPTPSE